MSLRKRPNKNQLVPLLHSALVGGVVGLSNVPGLLRLILIDELWKERVIPETGEVTKFESLIDFVQAPPPVGLGTDFETLWQSCSDDPSLLDLLDQAAQRERGAPKKKKVIDRKIKNVDTIHNIPERPSGTSRQAGLRQLRKHSPEMHAKVLAGELSINTALVQAGLRTKHITVFVDPERAAKTIKKAFSDEQLTELIALLITSPSPASQEVAEKLKKTLTKKEYGQVVQFLASLQSELLSTSSSSSEKE